MNIKQIFDELKKSCLSCKLCYRSTYSNVVFSDGSIHSKIAIVGRDPGYLENQFKKPFCGPSGKRLTLAIRRAKALRANIYITNLIKCAPKSNEIPDKTVIECCSSWLETELGIIKPKRIIALGKDSIEYFIGSIESVSSVRGSKFEFNEIEIYPTFHPSFVIRNINNTEINQIFDRDIKTGILGHE